MEDYWHVWCRINGTWTHMEVSGAKESCINWISGRLSILEHVCVNDYHNARTHDAVQKLYDSAKNKSKPLKQQEFQYD